MLTTDNFHKAMLVATAWRFMQYYGAGFQVGIMIMNTLANRVRAGWGSWLGVLEKVPTHMAESELPPLVFPSVWDAQFVKLLHAVDSVYEGSANDTSAGALYWCDTTKIGRAWFKEKIIDARTPEDLPQHGRVANMVSVTFWR